MKRNIFILFFLVAINVLLSPPLFSEDVVASDSQSDQNSLVGEEAEKTWNLADWPIETDTNLFGEVLYVMLENSFYRKHFNCKKLTREVVRAILKSQDRWADFQDPVKVLKDKMKRAGLREENGMVFEIPSVFCEFKEIHGEKVAIQKITCFHDRTPDQFLKSAEDIKNNKVSAIIFDLRDNPGGLLHSVFYICGYVVGSDAVIFQERNIMGTYSKRSVSEGSPIFGNIPVICLVNSDSASAAELMVACLRANIHADIIGQQTFKKGLIHDVFSLKSGKGNLILTTGEWLTSDGKKINDAGVLPDFKTRPGAEINVALRVIEMRKYRQSFSPKWWY